MKVKVKGIKLTESQQLIYDAANDKEHKIVVCNLSRQQGKSTVVLLLCIKWLTEPNQEIIYFTPTKELGRRFYDKLIKLLPIELIKKANSTDHFIETIANSTINDFFILSVSYASRFNMIFFNSSLWRVSRLCDFSFDP